MRVCLRFENLFGPLAHTSTNPLPPAFGHNVHRIDLTDLRHSFNTYMRKASVAQSVIMEITGHSKKSMFDRYNTIDLEDLLQAVDQFEAYL